MISSEVERTLVKSPPELWAELSNQESLARHLGQLGEIRITRVQPEESVEWEAQDTTGTILIKPSGWGTTVKLTAVRELPVEQVPVDPEQQPAAERERVSQPTPAETPVEPEPTALAEPETEPASSLEADAPAAPASEEASAPARAPEEQRDATAEAPEPPRRGFFARLFSRRRRSQDSAPATLIEEILDAPVTEGSPGDPPSDPFVAVRSVLAPETVAEAHLFAPEPPSADRARAVPAPTQAVPDISAELLAAEQAAAEQASVEEVTAVLTAVLDRLGAAHHRPFSRA